MLTVTKENYKKEVEEAEELVVIDFWAPWCGPCRMLSPIMESLSEEMADVKFCKVNVDEQPELAREFSVMSIPMVAVIKEGNVAQTLVGYRAKEEIAGMIEDYM